MNLSYPYSRLFARGLFAAAFFAAIFPLLFGCFSGTVARAAEPALQSAAEIDYPPFSVVDAEGRASGFSVELMRAALAEMGREVVFRTGPWKDVRRLLEQGKIQALPLVGRTPERESLFDFTFPYMSLHGAIVVSKNTSGIRTLSDLKGRQVAVMKGDNAEEFLKRKDRGIKIHTTATFQEALRALSEGRYDAVFAQRLVALRLIQEGGLTNLRVVNKPVEEFRQDFCFAVREGDRKTLALLNEGLALVLADGTYRRLHAKWFAATELPTHRKIVVGGDWNFPPYEYLDENGRPAGYNTDLTRAIAKEAGLDIEIRLGPWAEIRRALATGEIDVIQGMFYSPERDKIFDFTPPHSVNLCVSVVRKGEEPAPSTVKELAGKRIVVQRGDIMYDFALEHGLKDRVTALDSQEDALKALARGKFDCALVSRMTALYWIDKNGWKNLQVGRHPFLSSEYCYAVKQGNDTLLAQFSEGLNLLKKSGQYRRIQKKWMGVYENPSPGFTEILYHAALVLVPLVLLVLGFFLWSWSLRKQVANRTEALRKSEEYQRAMIACSPVALYSVDLNGNVTAWNESAERVFGWTAEEAIGGPLPIVPEGKSEEFNKLRKLIMSGHSFVGKEVARRRKDGTLFYGSLSAAPIRDAAGRIIGIMGAMEDISERKHAEEALKESEEKYRLLAENSEDVIFTLDMNLRYTYISPSVKTLRGFAVSEIIGRSIAESLKPESLTLAQKTLSEELALEKGKNRGRRPAKMIELEMLCRDGSTVWTEVKTSFLRDKEKKPVGILGVTRDISGRRQAERALRESEQHLKAIFESNANPIVVYDAKGFPQYLNPAFTEVFGWTLDELEGRPIPFVTEDEKRVTAAKIEEIYTHGRPVKFATKRLTKDGDTLEVIVGAALIKGFEGKGKGMVVNLTDISEQKKLETQLRQAQKMESIGRLAGGVAHDYNNMLGVILGYTEIALDSVEPEAPLHGYLEQILSAANRSSEITRQLLAFARRQTIAPRVIDLNETVEGMLKMLRRLIGEDIDLLWKPAATLWPVKMDPAQLDQILANLCVNARDAISGVGGITIETAEFVMDQAYCADHPGFVPGEFAMLAVSDDGSGMEKEVLDNLFEPFFTTKDADHGTGLGLAMVYGIVKQNNGFISVYSEPGQGTTFRIYLPRYLSGKGEQEVVAEKKIAAGRGETVLLVEDELAILQLGKMMLERLGYAVLEATTPTEALALAEKHTGKIHLLLTDVVMPDMNGRELADRLQSLYPEIQTLFMSGYTANVIAHRGVLDEGVDFLQKPFSQQELAVKVREALDGPGGATTQS